VAAFYDHTQDTRGIPRERHSRRVLALYTDGEPDALASGARDSKERAEAAIEAFEQLKSRGHPLCPPPLVSDGWGGYEEAMVEVWGQVPEYKGRGRPPTRKWPQAGWQYLKMVKQRKMVGL
jgi:hypothetical protein